MQKLVLIIFMMISAIGGFYYFPLRPEIQETQDNMRKVVTGLKDVPDVKVSPDSSQTEITQAFGNVLGSNPGAVPRSDIAQNQTKDIHSKLKSLGRLDENDRVGPSLVDFIAQPTGLDLDQAQQVLESHPKDTVDMVVGLIEQTDLDDATERNKILKSLRRLNFDDQGREVVSESLSNWTHNQDWTDPRRRFELSMTVDAIGSMNPTIQTQVVNELKDRYKQSPELSKFIEAQFGSVVPSSESAD